MLNLEYFKNQICDELDGALDYAHIGMEIKGTHPQWSKTFMEMSAMELGHATNLYKMCDEYYKTMASAYKEVPEYYTDEWDKIVHKYTEKYSTVKMIHDLYNK